MFPVVVELFTSLACSSCPPADAVLSQIATRGGNVLALDFHVTYWDRLGWKDPYSLAAATDRQENYSQAFGDQEVYTPEMVVNGVAHFVGSDRDQALTTIATAEQQDAPGVPLTLATASGEADASVGAGQGAGELLLVGYDPHHQTAVAGGENSGRLLDESNVVRSLQPLAAWHGQKITLRVTLPPGQRFALLLQSPKGQILGATTN